MLYEITPAPNPDLEPKFTMKLDPDPKKEEKKKTSHRPRQYSTTWWFILSVLVSDGLTEVGPPGKCGSENYTPCPPAWY
jgi:hypothetical protein